MSKRLAGLIACTLLTHAGAFGAGASGPVILVLGPPGSGKTLNAKKISDRYRIPSINMADLLKQSGGWGKAGSKRTLRGQVESGDLIGDEAAVRLLEQRLGKSDVTKGFILDGFPLTAKQAEYLDDVCRDRGLAQPVVVHLTVPDNTAADRMMKRGRADDEPETIERRLADYHAQAGLVLKRYPEVVTIDASGTPGEVWSKIEQALASRLPKGPR